MREQAREPIKIMLLRIVSFLSIVAMMPFHLHAYWDHAWEKEIPSHERGMGVSSHSITIDNADRPHIAYTACSKSGDCVLRHAVREGETWNDELVDPVIRDSAVRIAASVSGSLHLCYQGRDGVLSKAY
jgi:hypothetical protein